MELQGVYFSVQETIVPGNFSIEVSLHMSPPSTRMQNKSPPGAPNLNQNKSPFPLPSSLPPLPMPPEPLSPAVPWARTFLPPDGPIFTPEQLALIANVNVDGEEVYFLCSP